MVEWYTMLYIQMILSSQLRNIWVVSNFVFLDNATINIFMYITQSL